jgi:hypothetical protein
MEKRGDEMHMTQAHLIDLILKETHMDGPSYMKRDTPLPAGKVVHKYEGSPDFDGHFNYRRVIGRLLYLEKAMRPDIAAAVHMLARHGNAPKKEHGKLMKHLCGYPRATRDKGIIYRPNTESGFKCWVDASFAGNWSAEVDQSEDPASARSRTGFVIMYHGCSIIWASKLQTECALSSTEAEVIALSQSMREILPLMWLLKEIKKKGLIQAAETPKVRDVVAPI